MPFEFFFVVGFDVSDESVYFRLLPAVSTVIGLVNYLLFFTVINCFDGIYAGSGVNGAFVSHFMRQFKEVIGIKRPVKLVEFRVAEPHGIMHGIFFGQDNRYCALCYFYLSLSSVRCFKINADRLERSEERRFGKEWV